MKKALILFSMLVLSSVALAQQGSWYIGGLVGLSSSTDEPTGGVKSVSTEWDFSPEFGTFLKDDIQLGAALGINGGKDKVDGNDESKSFTLSPTIYGRKFFKIEDNFSLFAGLYLNLISRKTTNYGPTEELKTSGFGATLGAGVAYALSSRFTAVGQYGVLGFTSTKDKIDGTETGTGKDFGFGVNTVGSSVFNVGLYYTFKQ